MQPHFLVYTEYELGALAANLGSFPLDYGAYPPQSDSQDNTPRYSEFVWAG